MSLLNFLHALQGLTKLMLDKAHFQMGDWIRSHTKMESIHIVKSIAKFYQLGPCRWHDAYDQEISPQVTWASRIYSTCMFATQQIHLKMVHNPNYIWHVKVFNISVLRTIHYCIKSVLISISFYHKNYSLLKLVTPTLELDLNFRSNT